MSVVNLMGPMVCMCILSKSVALLERSTKFSRDYCFLSQEYAPSLSVVQHSVSHSHQSCLFVLLQPALMVMVY